VWYTTTVTFACSHNREFGYRGLQWLREELELVYTVVQGIVIFITVVHARRNLV
jgi:hypothetical protein